MLVLREKDGLRRLPVPVSKAEAAMIERGVRGPRGLAPATVEALGGRILRASIDEVSHGRRDLIKPCEHEISHAGHVGFGGGPRPHAAPLDECLVQERVAHQLTQEQEISSCDLEELVPSPAVHRATERGMQQLSELHFDN